MKKNSCQGGLLMFKKSFAQAVHGKEENPSENTTITGSGKNNSAQSETNNRYPQAINGKCESYGRSKRRQKSDRMKSRGRGQPLDSHNKHMLPGNCTSNSALPALLSSVASLKTMSNSSVAGTQSTNGSLPYQHCERVLESRQKVNRQHKDDNARLPRNRVCNPEHSTGKKPPVIFESRGKKPFSGHGRPTLKYRRSQDFALSQSQKFSDDSGFIKNTNLCQEKITSSAVKFKTVLSSTVNSSKNSETGTSSQEDQADLSSTVKSLKNPETSQEDQGDHNFSPLDKIQNMYKMYTEKIDEDKETDFSNESSKLKDSKSLCGTKHLCEVKFNDGCSSDCYLLHEQQGTKESGCVNKKKSPFCEADTKFANAIGRLGTVIESLSLSTSLDKITDDEVLDKQGTVEGHRYSAERQSISNSLDKIPDGEVLIIQEDIVFQEQESQSCQSSREKRSKTSAHPQGASSAESQTQNESADDHQTTIYSSELGQCSEIEVYSQSEFEPQESSQEEVNHSQKNGHNYATSDTCQAQHTTMGNFYGKEEMNNNQQGIQNEAVHHDSSSFQHPQFYPHEPASQYNNYFHSQGFMTGGSNQLILPSDGFTSSESTERIMRFVMAQRRRWEEYSENCYGYCAPLEVVISVRESSMWGKHPYPQPSPYFHPNAYPVPMHLSFYPAPYWRDPAWSNTFAYNSHCSFLDPHQPSVALQQDYGTSSGHRSSHYNGTAEEYVDGKFVSYEDDALIPQEVENGFIGHNPIELRSYTEEFYEKNQASDDGSGSYYSTANSGEVDSNRDLKTQELDRRKEVNTKTTNTTNRVRQMDANGTVMNTSYTPLGNATGQPDNSTPSRHQNQTKTSDVRNSISNFLTMEHLRNDWMSSSSPSPSPSAAQKRHPLRTFLESVSTNNCRRSAPYPTATSSRKGKNNETQEESASGRIGRKRGIVSFGEPVGHDNKANLSTASEPSISPKSTSDSSYFSSPLSGALRQEQGLKGRASLPLYAHPCTQDSGSHDFAQGPRPRSSSLSSDYDKWSTGASTVLGTSAGTEPAPTVHSRQPFSPKTLTSVSPCNHFRRRSFDGSDRWKIDLLRRSKSYNHTFIDSHCHIDFLFARTNLLNMTFTEFMAKHADSFPANYEGCVSVFCNPRTFQNYKPNGNDIINVVAKERGVWITAGCHPKNATDFRDEHLTGLLRILNHCPKVVALGEIGLDYSGKFKQFAQVQKQVFRRQLYIALDLKLPLVIHCRDADDDCLEIMQEIVPCHHKIHAHCFTRNLKMAHRWMSLFPNLYLGLTPLVTYRSAVEAIETAAGIPLERLLLETDAPYFVPTGVHLCHSDNKYSHPGLALYTAETVAVLKGIPVDDVLKATRENTHIVYNI